MADYASLAKRLGPNQAKLLMKVVKRHTKKGKDADSDSDSDNESADKKKPHAKQKQTQAPSGLPGIKSLAGLPNVAKSSPGNDADDGKLVQSSKMTHHNKVMFLAKKYGALGGFPELPTFGSLPSLLSIKIGDKISAGAVAKKAPVHVHPHPPMLGGAPLEEVKGGAAVAAAEEAEKEAKEKAKQAEKEAKEKAAAIAPPIVHGHPVADVKEADGADDEEPEGEQVEEAKKKPDKPDKAEDTLELQQLKDVVREAQSFDDEKGREAQDLLTKYAKEHHINAAHSLPAAVMQTFCFAKNYASAKFVPFETLDHKELSNVDKSTICLYTRKGDRTHHDTPFDRVEDEDEIKSIQKSLGTRKIKNTIHEGMSFQVSQDKWKSKDYVLIRRESLQESDNPPQQLNLKELTV